MLRRLPCLVGLLVVAAFVAGFRIYMMPERLMAERTSVYLKQANGYNRFIHQGLPDASWREFVSPSPDLLYSYLVFDTTKSAIAVEIPGYDGYWLNQMVDDQTDTFGYVGHRAPVSDPTRFVIFSNAALRLTTPAGFEVFKSPTPTGLFLLRYLVRSPDSVAKIDAVRQSIRVWELNEK
jgi:hypothetical protein